MRTLIALGLLTTVACAASEHDASAGSATGGSAGATVEAGAGGDGSGGSGGGVNPPDAGSAFCSSGAEQIHVLGFDLSEPVLYAFDPQTLGFKKLGPIAGCPQGSGFDGKNPWGAALDRNSVIWAHYLEWDQAQQKFVYDRMHTIDTATGACAEVGEGPKHTSNLAFEYGLAFLPDPADSAQDVLFGTAVGPGALFQSIELATIELPSLAVGPVAALDDTLHSYLAGTGDGRLYTLFEGASGSGLRQLDPQTGKSLSEQVVPGMPWGPFAFWGGDLWVFELATYEANELRTEVYRVESATWTSTQVASVDFVVTATSSSTCAPVEPPH